MKAKKVLNESDTKILKAARKILKRLQRKALDWDRKIWNMGDADKADAEQVKYDKWLDALYNEANVDLRENETFISLG